MTKETIAFQAETKELLNLVIHSLYTHKEIFLRELISNASDALDKRRFEALTDPALGEGFEPRIRLHPDPKARTLTIEDSGIGMSRDEVVANVGTIARSGTKGFLAALQEAKEKKTELPELPDGLIGQFGVGFYSAFMVADEVVLETRRAGAPASEGVRWSSKGDGEYSLETLELSEPGTRVTLHLKEFSEGEQGGADFTSEHVLRDVVKRYSDFISYGIEMEVGEGDEREWQTLNSKSPLWTRPRHEIEESEYHEFYKHLGHDWEEPLETIHFKAEGATEYTALLYLPRRRPFDLFDAQAAKSHVGLYVKRVFIMADCEELVPTWLRFVRGVVDSSDLPLNISRETLQHNRQMDMIRKRVTRKVVDALGKLAEERREDYAGFWDAFGPVLKEGIYTDDEFREELAKLCLFRGTHGEEATTLTDYVERMPVKQTEIYVLCAPDLETAKRSPHLEAVASKGYEVLFLVDPVDEFVLQRLTTFQDRPLRQIDKGDLELDEGGEKEEREAREKELEPLLESVRKELSERVESVRFSSRLTGSPACLVSETESLSPQLERMLRESGQQVPAAKRTLELNAGHPLVARLGELAGDDAHFARFSDTCAMLYETARIAEGSTVSDPAAFNAKLVELLLGS